MAREDITRLQGLLAAREEALTTAEADAEHRVETERAATTEVHERLATAREEAQRSMVAEAEETERLRAELERTREDAERLLAAERAEVARLREELLNSEVDDGAPDEASRRMVERMQRDLDRERATTRTLRRELEALRAESAEHRRSATATARSTDEDPTIPAATAARAARRVGRQRRVGGRRAPALPPRPRPRARTVRVGALVVRLIALRLIVAYGRRDSWLPRAAGAHLELAQRGGRRRRSRSPRCRCCCRGRWRSIRGVAGLGPRDGPARARHDHRAVLEAVPGAVHDGLRAVRAPLRPRCG